MSYSHGPVPLFSLPHVEDCPKRVRVLFGGEYIIDTQKAKLVWLKPYYPVYFFGENDVLAKYLSKNLDSVKEELQYETYDVIVGYHKAIGAATKHTAGELKGLVFIAHGAMDAWFEEDEQVFIHPKDPYKRVDVLLSSRNVRIVYKGQEIANTNRPRFLFETSLRRRTYIPKLDCRMDLLTPTELTTECPYKGVANYYDIRLPDGSAVENGVWWYRNPNPECIEIRGLVAFYDEKLEVYVDGELQQ
ncbi:hypothetical protein PHLGIDRAFT_196030 [Phlebiopsis gigantea 11061_1 CR5-6]|uniref:DUF427 domain-containing protein n=1 Tax=Phlebiopsis gigantea (strain 11061_1 CR5-6) TaxID=745531 RepID=A0A0C3S701_PHLG1|nr:hypothetical protein PHLGIDRAFT_196030 [Phlebiopsis gigantea 11061_1 CR5-6]